MARVGQEMINRVTKERLVWRATADSTRGAYCEFDLHLAAGAVVALPHAHPNQREDFRVQSGTLRLRIGRGREVLGAGDERSVPAGRAHAWGNADAGETHVVVRFTPALRVEDFFDMFCALADGGRLNSRGLPRNLLQLAVWSHEFRHEMALPSAVLRTAAAPVVAALAAAGRRAGYHGCAGASRAQAA